MKSNSTIEERSIPSFPNTFVQLFHEIVQGKSFSNCNLNHPKLHYAMKPYRKMLRLKPSLTSAKCIDGPVFENFPFFSAKITNSPRKIYKILGIRSNFEIKKQELEIERRV